MFSHFFIDRPIFASVLSIFITLAGALAALSLPIAQMPSISPPIVQVDCLYPGASAQVVAEAVAAPIEQQVNGVEGMMYMSSQCTNDGAYNLTVTFNIGVDVDLAQVLVQNRVALAVPSLPAVIKQTGVITRKRAPDTLMSIGMFSTDGRYDQLYLSNYLVTRVRDELARLEGVSEISMMGQRDYSMRVWVDPEKLASRNMTAGDVVAALREQNAEVATGQIGQPPAGTGQEQQLTLSVLGRLIEPEQFERIIVKQTDDGRVTRLKDIARVELGAKNQDVNCKVDGRPSVSMSIRQLPDANAFDTGARIRVKMEELKKDFPQGVDYVIRHDTTPYIRESVLEVFKSLRDAIMLVAAVVLLFLQNWRSALIPLVTVPVAIIGTFAVMLAFGFSINNLTLFGLVLAIGIVVDDAIVVVEAVEHHIDLGLKPREATLKAMQQVQGPVIAVGLVLSAVFVPCAFISGLTGQFFRQFALTIAVSTIISTFNSLTLSPALAALLLRPRNKSAHAQALPRPVIALLGGWFAYLYLEPELARHVEYGWRAVLLACAFGFAAAFLLSRLVNRLLGEFFRLFNAAFRASGNGYARGVGVLLRATPVALVVYCGLLALTYWRYVTLPQGFIPMQDMGYMLISVQLPDSASAERAQHVMDQIDTIVANTPGTKHRVSMPGSSFLLNASGSNFGSMFVMLKPFHERRSKDMTSEAIAARLRAGFKQEVYDAQVSVFPPPPLRGVGRAGGFKILIEDRGDLGLEALQEETDNLVEKARQQPELVEPSSVFRANVPQLYVDVDRKRCISMGVALKDIFDTMQIYLGSLYVNDFNRFGRTWQVIVQADARFRNNASYVRQLKVRSATGDMVPLGSLAAVREVNGPLVLTRYNMYPAAFINGSAAPGTSSRDAIAAMQELAKKELPGAMATEWTEMAYLELAAGNTAMTIFVFSVAMVFLVLAAQYESWSLPLAVILVVPMCLLSATSGVAIAHQDINIFTQIGFVVLVGLASKNAILIVEFAKRQRELGVPRFQATLAACQLRLRPIIMTSCAFILGVLPLLFARGAAAEMRRTLGTAVFSGMLGVTLFGIFLTPVFFYVVNRLSESWLFGIPWVRRVVDITLGVLALGYLRKMARIKAGG